MRLRPRFTADRLQRPVDSVQIRSSRLDVGIVREAGMSQGVVMSGREFTVYGPSHWIVLAVFAAGAAVLNAELMLAEKLID